MLCNSPGCIHNSDPNFIICVFLNFNRHTYTCSQVCYILLLIMITDASYTLPQTYFLEINY